MKSKLAVLAVVVTLFSLPCALAQTNSEPAAPAVNRELRREIDELKQRIAELEARLKRLEVLEKHLLRRESRLRQIDGWDLLPGSYLRFPADVERAMIGDGARLPRAVPEVRPQR